MRRSRLAGWLDPAVLAAAGLAAAAGFAQFAITAVLSDVAGEFGTGGSEAVAAEVGMTGTALGLGLAIIRLAAIGSLPVAGLADRLGRRRVVIASCAAGLAVTAAAGLSPGWWTMVATLAVARPLLAATNAVAGVIAAEETSAVDRSKAIALIGGAYAAGTGVVAVVRGLIDAVVGFRGVFALALVPLVLMPLLVRRVRDSPLYAEAARAPRARLGAIPSELVGRLATVCVLHIAAGVVTGPLYTYLFVYGEGVLDVEPLAMAALVVAAGPTGLIGLVVGQWLADRIGRRWTAAGAMVIAAVAATIGYSGGLPAFAGGYLTTVVAGAAYTPAAGALDAEIFPTSARASAAGWISAAQIIGAVIGLAAFGFLADALQGFSAAAAALWLPTGFVALLYARLPETRGMELRDVPPA